MIHGFTRPSRIPIPDCQRISDRRTLRCPGRNRHRLKSTLRSTGRRSKTWYLARQIFTEGVGGKLYIADLAVPRQHGFSLTVGEADRARGAGCFTPCLVDEGNITTELKQD